MSAGAHNSAHSERWRGPQGRYVRKYVKLRRTLGGAVPMDGKRLEAVLAEDRRRRQEGKA